MGSLSFICLSFLSLTSVARTSETENVLIQHLFRNYNKDSRPVAEHKDPVRVKFGLTILQFIDVNDKAQILTTSAWIRAQWHDTNLQWNASAFGSIGSVGVPIRRLWCPDISLFNTAEQALHLSSQGEGINSMVFSTGDVVFVQPVILKSSCLMDVTWFPFDRQTCILKFGSWTHSRRALDIVLQAGAEGALDLSSYIENGKWSLVDYKMDRTEKIYPCCPTEPYIEITYRIVLKRKSLYYFFNLITPCALIGFLAVLGFTLPPDSGEKLSLGVTVLFSLIVFLNMISETMPANSDAVPLLGTYFSCVMFMIASSVVSTIVINLNLRAAAAGRSRQMSGRTRKILLDWLPWALRMRALEVAGKAAITAESPGVIPEKKRISDSEEGVSAEWKFAAIVVDRLALLASLMFALVSTMVLLISAISVEG